MRSRHSTPRQNKRVGSRRVASWRLSSAPSNETWPTSLDQITVIMINIYRYIIYQWVSYFNKTLNMWIDWTKKLTKDSVQSILMKFFLTNYYQFYEHSTPYRNFQSLQRLRLQQSTAWWRWSRTSGVRFWKGKKLVSKTIKTDSVGEWGWGN